MHTGQNMPNSSALLTGYHILPLLTHVMIIPGSIGFSVSNLVLWLSYHKLETSEALIEHLNTVVLNECMV